MTNPNDNDQELLDALAQERSPALYCDNCGFYPIEPVHGHFVCPECHVPTKCCEGGPIFLEPDNA